MKESIKNRIEAVRRGEVPEGYVSKNHQLRPADWKYEKIGKYLVPYDEFSNDTEAYPLATSSRQGLMLQSEYYSDQRYEKTTGGFHVVPVGYVTYRHMSDDDIFRFNVNKMGQPVLVSPEYPVFTTTGELDQELLVAYLNGMKEFQAFCSAQKKGSTRTRMYFHRLGEFTIPIPSITEQQKIAEILATCDRMIELKQNKIDELNKLKQVCLLEMFPKEGQAVPETRFKGFTAPWEQRKLTEFVEFFSGLTYTPNDVQENGTLVLRSSNVSNGEVVDADNVYVNPQVVNSENVKVGDIVVVVRNGSRSLIGKHAQIKAFMPNTVIGAFMTGIRSECPEFTNALLNTSRFEEEIAMNMGATINQITGYMFSKMEFKVPCLDEQKKIGEYFEKLDRLVTLHQREWAEVGKYKKALMQLLLTGLVRVNA